MIFEVNGAACGFRRGHAGDYYDFSDGIYYEYDSGSSNRHQYKNYKFTVVDWNTIRVYSYKNGTTYTLYRK